MERRAISLIQICRSTVPLRPQAFDHALTEPQYRTALIMQRLGFPQKAIATTVGVESKVIGAALGIKERDHAS